MEKIGTTRDGNDLGCAGLLTTITHWDFKMAKKSLKVDRNKFEGIVKNLLNATPVKRDEVKPDKKKPEKLIPPPKK